MKKIFSFVAVMIAALSIGLTSCTEDPAAPIAVDMSAGKTAQISGTLLVNADITKALADQSFSGVDANIIVTVPYADILDDAAAKGTWSTTITSGKNGKFTVEVPATSKGVNVSFSVSDKYGERKQKVGPDDKTLPGKWSFNIADKNVKSGQQVILEHTEGTFAPLKEDGSKL